MPLEDYDILLTDLNIFTLKIYNSSHGDIVKSSHLSCISCTSDREDTGFQKLVKTNPEKQSYM